MALIGKGTTLSNCATKTGTYAAIAKVINVADPKRKMDKVDATDYESPDDHMEYEPTGWSDTEDVTFTTTYDKTKAGQFDTDFGVKQWWKVTKSDGSTWVFPGFIGELGGENPNKDKLTQEVKICVTGKAEFTPAA